MTEQGVRLSFVDVGPPRASVFEIADNTEASPEHRCSKRRIDHLALQAASRGVRHHCDHIARSTDGFVTNFGPISASSSAIDGLEAEVSSTPAQR
jgi:hypothetical protein